MRCGWTSSKTWFRRSHVRNFTQVQGEDRKHLPASLASSGGSTKSLGAGPPHFVNTHKRAPANPLHQRCHVPGRISSLKPIVGHFQSAFYNLKIRVLVLTSTNASPWTMLKQTNTVSCDGNATLGGVNRHKVLRCWLESSPYFCHHYQPGGSATSRVLNLIYKSLKNSWTDGLPTV